VVQAVYRWLLRLYPGSYRDEFAEEMTSVFCEARNELGPAKSMKLSFYGREFYGLCSGALRAHVERVFGAVPFRGFYMQPQRRFPHSTVFLTCVILAGVVLAIEKAKTVVQMKEGLTPAIAPGWHPLFWFFPFAVALVIAGAVWGILFALRRTGMHRLDNMHTWPEQKS
jgi:hypothetical protein